MRQLIAALLVCLLASPSLAHQPAAPPADQPAPAPSKQAVVKRTPGGKIILEDGTPIRCRVKRNLSSTNVRTGDRIDFEVMDPVVLDGITVVPRGANAWGAVTKAEPLKSMGRAGRLDIEIVAVRLANAETANLRAVKASRRGMVIPLVIPTPYVIVVLIFYKVAVIPSGTEITAYIAGDKVFEPAAAPVAAPVPAVPAMKAVAVAHLSLTSNPSGADLEVDGDFIGNTPSSVELEAGEHVVRATKKGFQPYERKLHVGGGNVSLVAELTPAQAQ